MQIKQNLYALSKTVSLHLTIDQKPSERVHKYTYLGTIVNNQSDNAEEVKYLTGKVCSTKCGKCLKSCLNNGHKDFWVAMFSLLSYYYGAET